MTYPVMLDGARLRALVVGGGEVAARKTRALLDGEVPVTLVAPRVVGEIDALASAGRIRWENRTFEASDVESADIIIAATDDRDVNSRVASLAASQRRLVNVVDDPAAGTFSTPSVHRTGDVVIAVSTGRTPAAAAAIRKSVGSRFDHRYAQAIGVLRALRERLFAADRHEDWRRASKDLIGDEFCADVEEGRLESKVSSWR